MSRVVELEQLGIYHPLDLKRKTVGDLIRAHKECGLTLEDVLVISSGYVVFDKLFDQPHHENAYEQINVRKNPCLLMPLNLTRRYVDAVAHFANLHEYVMKNTQLRFGAYDIELLPDDRGLLALYGDKIDRRCYSYTLAYSMQSSDVTCITCKMVSDDIHVSHVYLETNETGFQHLRQLIDQRTTVKQAVAVVLNDDIPREVDVAFDATSYFSYTMPVTHKRFRRVGSIGKSSTLTAELWQRIAMAHIAVNDLQAYCEKVTRLVTANELGGIYVGRPDRCDYTHNSFYSDPTDWIAYSIIRRPRQHDIVTDVCLALSGVAAPFELLEVVVRLPGMAFFPLLELRVLLFEVYRSIRLVRNMKDGPARSTRQSLRLLK